jgi:hypothetical protein
MRTHELVREMDLRWAPEQWQEAVDRADEQQRAADLDLSSAHAEMRAHARGYEAAVEWAVTVRAARARFTGATPEASLKPSEDPARAIAEAVYSRFFAFMPADQNVHLAGEVHRIVTETLYPSTRAKAETVCACYPPAGVTLPHTPGCPTLRAMRDSEAGA